MVKLAAIRSLAAADSDTAAETTNLEEIWSAAVAASAVDTGKTTALVMVARATAASATDDWNAFPPAAAKGA